MPPKIIGRLLRDLCRQDELARLQSSIKYADDRVCAAYRSSLQDTNAGGDWDKRSSAVCAGYSAARFCNSLCKGQLLPYTLIALSSVYMRREFISKGRETVMDSK